MDSRALISNVATAVVTAIVLGVGGFLLGVFEKGNEAINKEQIKAVIAEVMVTDAGKTYAATLNSIDKSVGEINVSIGAIKEDIDDLENAVGVLAGE